ncbi:hypothetical protein BDZ94DRAFT_1214630 [Collybia nuda]|uniref:Uncharacterized protein n=1 Tax=Collybia nuda TaxID=64659 RepID=A0A9P5YBL7_9AGAR|nr:hypothetical protein BDZ94DRAFT_1214630 [Collybia nuda]
MEPINDPHCIGMEELPSAINERAKVSKILHMRSELATVPNDTSTPPDSPLFKHLSHGMAYTAGSALGSSPPSVNKCLAAYLVPNKADLTAGARAWSKHSHRSGFQPKELQDEEMERRKVSAGWWGIPSGPVAVINEKALVLFWKVMNGATWKNLHWLPHQVLVYEIRVAEGYGMRWSQNQKDCREDNLAEERPWLFRGFVEPMMENGHEVGWHH